MALDLNPEAPCNLRVREGRGNWQMRQRRNRQEAGEEPRKSDPLEAR